MKARQRLRQQGVELTVEKTDAHDMMTSARDHRSIGPSSSVTVQKRTKLIKVKTIGFLESIRDRHKPKCLGEVHLFFFPDSRKDICDITESESQPTLCSIDR